MIKSDRLRARIAAQKTTQADLARAIGVSPQAVSKMVTGDTTDTSKLYQIASFLNTTPAYLAGESDEAEPSALSDRRLGFRGAEPDRSDLVEIAQYDVAYGMGSSYLHDEYVEPQRMIFSRAWVRHFTSSPFDQIFFAQGIGDSMTPTIGSSDIVLIDTAQRTPRAAELIWAVEMHGLGMIKRLRPAAEGAVLLIADNPAISAIPCADGEMNIIGRVVAVVKRL